MKESHEAIISEEEYNIAQIELEERKSTLRQHSSKAVFSGKLICGDCGSIYGSKLWHSQDKYRRTVWQCNGKFKNKCTTPHLKDDEIKAVSIKAVNKILTDKTSVIKDLTEIRKLLLDTKELDKKLADAVIELEYAEGLIKSYFNGSAITEKDATSGKFEEYQTKYTEVKEKVDKLEKKITDRKNRALKMQRFISKIEDMDELVDEFSEKMFLGLVDHMVVYSKERIIVVFKCGREVEVSNNS